MSENEFCTECGSPNLLNDNENGELVCQTCGLVLGSSEFAPPPDRIQKNLPTHPLAYTSLSVGTEINSHQRTEQNVANDINHTLQQLDLPLNMKQIAITYLQKIRRATKKQQNNNHPNSDSRIRLTRTELTALSIWTAIKLSDYPLSADEYLKKLQTIYKVQNLMKIEKRANHYIKNQNRLPTTILTTKHINKITTQLENTQLIEKTYANKLCSYAIQIIHVNPGIITSRRSRIVAASAILAADALLAKQLRLKSFAQIVNVGTSSLSSLTETCKQYAPPLPPDCAAIKFSSYLLKEVKLC
jgi:transcription initiation factor TFIIIB Brf1 subunit/transcription initiation factor TFIIB